jgi:hypothetical protein
MSAQVAHMLKISRNRRMDGFTFGTKGQSRYLVWARLRNVVFRKPLCHLVFGRLAKDYAVTR